jgi:hypothetical protein
MKIAITALIAVLIGFLVGLLTFRQMHFSKKKGKNGWNEGGITQESRFINLFYCPSSGHMVAQFCNSSNLQSLYVRHDSESLYRKVPKDSPDLSYDDPVVADSTKSLFFNIMKSDPPNGMNWEMVAKLDLSTNHISPILTGKDQKEETFWISRLYRMTPDEDKLVCSAFIDGDYWLCYLTPNNKQLEKITLLKHTFF